MKIKIGNLNEIDFADFEESNDGFYSVKEYLDFCKDQSLRDMAIECVSKMLLAYLENHPALKGYGGREISAYLNVYLCEKGLTPKSFTNYLSNIEIEIEK